MRKEERFVELLIILHRTYFLAIIDIISEVIEHKPYGLSSDIWSLGVILHMFLVGTAPFPTHTGKSIFTNTKVSVGDLSLPESLSVEARDLIRRLLHKVLKQ